MTKGNGPFIQHGWKRTQGANAVAAMHDDVIKWKHFPRYWPFVRGIHRSPVNSPHKGQWRGALMFSLICVLNKRLSKQSWGWWFETPKRSLWRHCNVMSQFIHIPASALSRLIFSTIVQITTLIYILYSVAILLKNLLKHIKYMVKALSHSDRSTVTISWKDEWMHFILTYMLNVTAKIVFHLWSAKIGVDL